MSRHRPPEPRTETKPLARTSRAGGASGTRVVKRPAPEPGADMKAVLWGCLAVLVVILAGLAIFAGLTTGHDISPRTVTTGPTAGQQAQLTTPPSVRTEYLPAVPQPPETVTSTVTRDRTTTVTAPGRTSTTTVTQTTTVPGPERTTTVTEPGPTVTVTVTQGSDGLAGIGQP